MQQRLSAQLCIHFGFSFRENLGRNLESSSNMKDGIQNLTMVFRRRRKKKSLYRLCLFILFFSNLICLHHLFPAGLSVFGCSFFFSHPSWILEPTPLQNLNIFVKQQWVENLIELPCLLLPEQEDKKPSSVKAEFLLLNTVIFLNHLMNEVMKHGHQHVVGNSVLSKKDLNALILKRLACLFGSLWSSACVQKMFCRSCSICRWISDVFVGRDALSLSYSSAILEVLMDLFFSKVISVILCNGHKAACICLSISCKITRNMNLFFLLFN